MNNINENLFVQFEDDFGTIDRLTEEDRNFLDKLIMKAAEIEREINNSN